MCYCVDVFEIFIYVYELNLVLMFAKSNKFLCAGKKLSQCAVGLKEFNELIGVWRQQKIQYVLLFFCFLRVKM